MMNPFARAWFAVFGCALAMMLATATGAHIPVHTEVILAAAAGACGWFWPRPK